MDPELLAALATTALGGGIGVGGAWFGSWRTERQARRERERRACQAILRLLPRVGEALEDESKIDWRKSGDSEAERYEAVSAAVDRLGEELAVLVTDLPQEDRQKLDLCVEALVERARLDLSPATVGRRAIRTVRALITARMDKQQVADWTHAVLKGFVDDLATVHKMDEENYHDQQQWEREERERRKKN